ncbi:MAG TPA: VWA domain-containing protein [Vicinamibacterales bacterium]|nr:VWA domain-containing protein [Vicinamibacterales bacterium]
MQESNLQRNLLVFGRLLRRLGIDVHVGRLLDVTEALQHVDLASRDEVYYTCRALLVYRHEQLAIFDRAFDAFWLGRINIRRVRLQPDEDAWSREQEPAYDSAGRNGEVVVDGPDSDASEKARPTGEWSDIAALGDKDFAEFTADEVALARQALERLVWNPGERRTRRWIAGHGSRVDLRRALAGSLRTGGDVITLPRRRRRMRRRSLVLLCDVSGSMERYSRMLLHFVHTLSRRHRRVEVFLFATELTRITMQLRTRRVDDAAAAVSRAVPDWSSGTRIGTAIAVFHRRWARRVLRGHPVVLLISDGWDRGDPIELRDQVAWLQRSCHRLIWLNPLIGTVGYAPLTRGLQAALPFVDDFLPVRTLSNLADLAVHLNALGPLTRARRSWTSQVPTLSTPRPNASGIS